MRMIVAAGLLFTSVTSLILVYLYTNQGGDTSVTGILTEDAGVYSVDGAELSFGPQSFVMNGTSPADYDGDGSVETVQQELNGLIGTTVTVQNPNATANAGLDVGELWKKIRRGDLSWPNDAGQFDVFIINGHEYRNPDLPPPWSGQYESEATPAVDASPRSRISYLRHLTSRVLGGSA